MPKSALVRVPDQNFELVKEYLATGSSSIAITEEHRRMIDICRNCWGLMSKYPQRNVLIHQVMVQNNLQYKEAAKYVDFTRQTWGDYQDVNQSFLQSFFMDQLLKAISDPKAKPETKAKNLSTLQKHLQNMPHTDIDPTLMEANSIVINFNLGDKNFQLSQEVIRHLPKEIQEQLFAGVGNDITDVDAEEVLES